jgi:HEAT repeat protein
MGIFGPPNVKRCLEKRDVDGLIKALDYKKDYHVRLDAIEALGELGRAGDGRALERLISLTNAELHSGGLVSINLINALIKTEKADAISVLIDVRIKTRNWNVSRNYLFIKEELVRFGEPVIEPLIKTFAGAEAGWRDEVIEILAGIGGRRVIEFLVMALHDQEDLVRKSAAKALWKSGYEPEDKNELLSYRILLDQWDRCGELGEIAIEPLVSIIETNVNWTLQLDHEHNYAALRGLVKIGAPAITFLVNQLEDETRTESRSRLKTQQILEYVRHPKKLDREFHRDNAARASARQALAQIRKGGLPEMKAVLQAKQQGEISILDICSAAAAHNTDAINNFLDALLDEGSQWSMNEIMEIAGVLMERKYLPRKRYDTDGIIKRILKEMEEAPAEEVTRVGDQEMTDRRTQNPDHVTYDDAQKYLRHI